MKTGAAERNTTRFEYYGTNWLKEGFVFPGLYDYIEETKERLRQPLSVPEYATAGEAERIRRFSEKAKENPYLQRAGFAEAARQLKTGMGDVRSIPFGEYPLLYNVCVFASKTLTGVPPITNLYTSGGDELRYNAFALDYQDKVWIYISDQFFKEHGMLKVEELCFIVGHELGHTQCHHSTLGSDSSYGSDKEYSADRAGMIVCARWMLEHLPGCAPEYAASRAALYGVSSLLKLELAGKNWPDRTDWSRAVDYEELQSAMDRLFDNASKLTVSSGSHPHDRHRAMAMINFSQSQLFYRCLGFDPGEYPGLLSDAVLGRFMSFQLTNE